MINKFLFNSIFLKVIIAILMPSIVSAATSYEIHTWGYGDLLSNVLEATKDLVGSGRYLRMVQIALTIGILITALSLMNARDFSIVMVAQKVVVGILLYTFVIGSNTDVVITDHTTGEAPIVVRQVPSVIGFPLYLFSNLERGASELFRESLSKTEASLTALGSLPVTTGYDLLYTASNYRIQDPKVNQTINEFINNCIYPDVLTGYIDIATLGEGREDFWMALASDTHPARISGIFRAGSDSIDGELQPCPAVYNYINDDILEKYTAKGGDGFKRLASSIGFSAAGKIDETLGSISRESFGYQKSGSTFLKNAIAMNSFNDAYVQTAAQVGIDTSALAYGMAKGSETTATQMTLSGIMAKKYMPISKGFMTVILIALIPIILLIALATNSLKKPLGMIVGILTALSLWAIGTQLLDFFILIRTKEMLTTVVNAGGDYSLMTKPIIETSILDSVNMAMSMYWMIPTLSFAIASMNGYAASQMMSGAGATANSAISGAAGEIASGSRSMGVVRENMMSANRFDGVSSMSTGQNLQHSNSRSLTAKDTSETSLLDSTKNINEDVTLDKYENRSVHNTRDSNHTGGDNLSGIKTVNDNSTKNLSGTSYNEDNSKITNDSINLIGGTNNKGVLQEILEGNSSSVNRVASLQKQHDENPSTGSAERNEAEKQKLAADITSEMAPYYSKNESENYAVSGAVNIAGLGGGTTHATALNQNVVQEELYEILRDSNPSDYQQNLNAYVNEKINTNLEDLKEIRVGMETVFEGTAGKNILDEGMSITNPSSSIVEKNKT